MIRMLKNRRGESLVEILMSIALLSLVAIVFLRAITSLVTMSSKTDDRMDGSFMAERMLEYLNQTEGKTINGFRTTIIAETTFSCMELSGSNPYRFKIEDDDYPQMYAVIVVDYKKYASKGNLSAVTIRIFSTSDDSELSFMEDVIYWV